MYINEVASRQIEVIKEKCKVIKPVVIIWCTAYNHERYLRDALEGFIKQNTDFPFVAIVHEDVSTDGTAEILKEYAQKYPDIVFPIFEKENQYSKRDGSLERIMDEVSKATGAKYLALCEGDDYWIDPLKLQKQIDFLENHPEIAYTCHRYFTQIDNDSQLIPTLNSYLDSHPNTKGFEFDLQYAFTNEWITKTLTAVYRLGYAGTDNLRNCTYYRDMHIVYEILSKANGYCFQFVGGVYRIQDSGVWSQSNDMKKMYVEVKTWENIYSIIHTKFIRWKIRNSYAKYILYSIKTKKCFKISNIMEFRSFICAPIELMKIKMKYYKNKEIQRIAKLKLNQEDEKLGV